jgi:hypothetical protein
MPESFKVNSKKTGDNCIEWVKSLCEKHKYFQLILKTDDKRTIDQNSLLHQWLTDWLKEKSGYKPSKRHVEQLKRSLKEELYRQGLHYTLEVYDCPITNEQKKRWRSTREYTVGEMTEFLDFMQCLAGEQGVILVARGEYKINKEGMNE